MFTYNTWIEPCDVESIKSVKDYLRLIPKNFDPDCYGCMSCGGVYLDLINDIDFATNGTGTYYDEVDEIRRLHRYVKYWNCEWCRSTDDSLFTDDHCDELSWDGSYFRKWNHKYFYNFRYYLHYCSENQECDCYWVERCERALAINNLVYSLFENFANQELITPNFSEYWIAKSANCVREDGTRTYTLEYYPNAHGMASSLSTYTFFYSQYHQVLMDVATFIDSNSIYGNSNSLDQIYETLRKIMVKFLPLYNYCLKNHPHPKIFYERGMLKLHSGDNEGALQDIQSLMSLAESDKFKEQDILTSEMYQQEGEAYADIGTYDKAIASLSHAIEKDPNNKEAYFQRAAAYFETGNFEHALSDYLTSEKSKGLSHNLKTPNAFAGALKKGLIVGAKEAAVDFFPSLLNSAYGMGETLWVFGQHPIEQTTNFANACYNATECAVKFCEKLDWAKVEGYADDFKQLCENYYKLSDAEKGEQIGYLVGKYSVDILAPGATMKGIAAYKKFRDANRICNLEALLLSSENKIVLEELALKHSLEREIFFQKVKIDWYKQGKHISTAHNFQPGKSVVTINQERLNILLRQNAGKGQRIIGEIGTAGYKERVDFKQIIGEWSKIMPDNSVKMIPTTKGVIVYSKTGMHMYPSNPDWY